MGQLDGTVALITGGGSGLGLAIVRRFVAEGALVAVLELSSAKTSDLTDEFDERVLAITGDVSNPADNERAVSETLRKFGRLDTFVGNAGMWDFGAPFDSADASELGAGFDELFAVNVKGFLLGARASLDALRATRGSIIFTLSNAATLPGGGGVLYVASKHAGVGIVRQLAHELKGEVRVNAVAPGLMSTDLRGPGSLSQTAQSIGNIINDMGGEDELAELFGLSFFPQPEDYVGGYVLLASSEARTTTGTVIEMHGLTGPPPPGRFEARH